MTCVFHNPYRCKKVDLNKDFKKKGLTEEEIKNIFIFNFNVL